jgi:hypothetical protein
MGVSGLHITEYLSRRALCLMVLVLCAGAMTADPVLANSSKAPKYSLSIVEGETTLPEHIIAETRAGAPSQVEVAVSIIRNGITIARDTGEEGGAWLSQVPQSGDVVTVESPAGTLRGAVTYDGLPSIDPSVCAPSTNFSGQRSGAMEVQGGYYTEILVRLPYGRTELRRPTQGQAQVTALIGSAYAGNFLTPLALGETVWASESLVTPLEGGATFTYTSENDRPVSPCPPPPPPPPPPPALGGSVLKLSHARISRLLHSGWVDQVTINQPGTVVQDLFLQGGALPAYASSKRHRVRKPPPVLLARGSASATAAGTVNVTLRLTAKGRRRLKHAHSVKAVLVTTLVSSSGTKLSLARHSLSLHR